MNYGIKGVVKKRKLLDSNFSKYDKLIKIAFVTCLITFIISVSIIGISLGLGLFKGIIDSSPDISSLNILPTGYSTLVYDNTGVETAKLISADSNRRYRTMDQIPENLANAFVAIEDERFYSHNGIDIKGILRALVSTFQNAELGQGASTITQQVLKNNVFDNWINQKDGQMIKRKIQEQFLAIELEKQMALKYGDEAAKNQILEIYMNTINLGQGTLGVEAASRRYFDKSAYELTLSECATIAGITQNPSYLNPISYPKENAKRRDKILLNMKEQGYITEYEYNIALQDNVYDRIQEVNEVMKNTNTYSYFIDELIEQVLEDLKSELGFNDTQAYNALFGSGLSIFTTQDPYIQQVCNDVYSNPENYNSDAKWLLKYELTIEKANGELENHSTEMYTAYYKEQNSKFNLIYNTQEDALAAIEEYKLAFIEEGDTVRAENISFTPQPQISFTIEEQSTGHILAMIGGRGVKEASRTLNRATNTTRSPGSTFKTIAAYGPALDSNGITLADVYNDAPFNYLGGRPIKNYDNQYHGLVSVRHALMKSYNIPAVKVITEISPQLSFDYLMNLGFSTLEESKKIGNQIYTDIRQPLALGGLTNGVTNMELNAAYAAIANNGTYVEPTLYTKILDQDGNILIDKSTPNSKKVFKESTAFLLTTAMQSVVTSGTGGKARFSNMSIAGKTGTSSDDYDSWFSGFTPYYTATAWTGYDNNVNMSTPEKDNSKILWRKIMSTLHEELENKPFNRPSDITSATICTKSGKLPIPGLCDATLGSEYFADGTVPTDTCNVHYQGNYCTYSGLPAQEYCPFKAAGVLELIPPERVPGSVITTLDPTTGLPTTTTVTEVYDPNDPNAIPPNAITYCPHDNNFFAQPNYEDIINQQKAEMQQRAIAAQQAAEAAAAAGQ